VSKARDLYISSVQGALFGPGKETAFKSLSLAADLWRETGQYFSAGMAMSIAIQAAWGFPQQMLEAQNAAMEDLRVAVANNPEDSLVGLASLHKLHTSLRQALWLFEMDARATKSQIRSLGEELAQRFLTHFAASKNADNYLVKGIFLLTDLDDNWGVAYPTHDVDYGGESFGNEVRLAVPSAFHLFVAEEDWQGANEIVKRHPGAFSSPGLRGWRAVVLANIDALKAVEFFDEAADAFSEDKLPSDEELVSRGGSWSGINEQLWTKYFRARARLNEAIRKPAKVKRLIASALESLGGTESGWHSGEVSKFRVLVNTLAKLIAEPEAMDSDKAAREYLAETRLSQGPSEFDDYALRFITEAAQALVGFQTDPYAELTRNRLASALDALSRVPFIGSEITEVVRPAIGKSALALVLGPVRTWMHRSLQSITDELKLQVILLRLLQAGLPLYAQVRHGPIEYGKDIVALVEENGEVALRFYQLKCGDLDKQKWRISKEELEEMFLVKIPSLQLPRKPDRVVGILVCNGHANPYVEPVIDAWISEQQEKNARSVEFHHLDTIVDWIADHLLVNELKLALAEQNISITDSPEGFGKALSASKP
jgi:hypothetical protein